MKLLWSTKSKITKDENGENEPHLENCNFVIYIVTLSPMIINKIQESCIHLFLINRLVNY